MKTLLLILLFPALSLGQSISVSPTSFQFWGMAKQTSLIEAEYKNFSAVALYAHQSYVDPQGAEYKGLYPAIFYSPIQVGNRFYLKGSTGIFMRKYPTDNGQRVHFRLQAGFTIGKFSIEYSHISNGFGLLGKFNAGVDNISIRFKL